MRDPARLDLSLVELSTDQISYQFYMQSSLELAAHAHFLRGRFISFSYPQVAWMAGSPLAVRLSRSWRSINGHSICSQCSKSPRRLLSTQSPSSSIDGMEENPSLVRGSSPVDASSYDPVKNAKNRKYQLPPSRYVRVSQATQSQLTLLDTNTVHLGTIADLCTHINRRHPMTRPPASSSLGHSPIHGWSRPIIPSSPRTS